MNALPTTTASTCRPDFGAHARACETPKPTASGRAGDGAHRVRPAGRRTLERRVLLAGDAGARDQIDEAAGVLRDQLQAALGAGGRGEEYGVETAARMTST